MSKISNSDKDIIVKFFDEFTSSVVRILSGKFDEDVFDKINFSIGNISQVDSLENLKGSNLLYRFNYSVEGAKGSFVTIVPEELVALSSDLLMGGEAQKAYKGTLTELEVNASSGLFASILDDMQITFKTLYVKEFLISPPEAITKDAPKYNEIFSSNVFDTVVSYELALGSERKFDVILLANAAVLKQLLINIDLLEEVFMQNLAHVMPQPKELDGLSDISKIADVKINISAELGRIKIPIKQVMGLVGGSIIELDTHDNADIKVFANGLEVARAQVVVVDEHFGIKITKIISPEERYKDI